MKAAERRIVGFEEGGEGSFLGCNSKDRKSISMPKSLDLIAAASALANEELADLWRADAP